MSDPKDKNKADVTDPSILTKAVDDLALSDDPFAQMPAIGKASVTPVKEEEVTVKEALRRKRNMSVAEEPTIVHRILQRTGLSRADVVQTELHEQEVQRRRRQRSGKLRRFLSALLFLFLGAALVFGGYWGFQRFLARTAPVQTRSGHSSPIHRPRSVPPRLSNLSFFIGKTITSPRTLKPGSKVIARFFVESWEAKPGAKANLSADLRLFDGKGKMIVALPNSVAFAQKIDKATKRLQVDYEISVGMNAPIGAYQLIIDVEDRNAHLHTLLQAKLQVVK